MNFFKRRRLFSSEDCGWAYGFAYHDAWRDETVLAPLGFNILIRFVHLIWLWCRKPLKETVREELTYHQAMLKQQSETCGRLTNEIWHLEAKLEDLERTLRTMR